MKIGFKRYSDKIGINDSPHPYEQLLLAALKNGTDKVARFSIALYKKNRPESNFRSGTIFLILLWLPVTNLRRFDSAFGF